MTSTTQTEPRRTELRALLEGGAVLALTSIHHAYGAVRYTTPWRYHAVYVSIAAMVVMVLGLVSARNHPNALRGRIAWWVFWTVSVAVPVSLIGAFEGAYNHVLKNLLFFSGMGEAQLLTLFPPPKYELPNDLLFEITGVLQVIPAVMAAYHLVALAIARLKRGGLGATPPRLTTP